MSLEIHQEYDISPVLHETLMRLRNSCFPDHLENRSYGKQLPHFRMLYRDQDQIVAQMGIDHRVVRVADEVFRIFGIIDLCVEKDHRNKNFASRMIEELSKTGKNKGVDFLYLMAKDHRLYLRNGFESVDTLCTWLRISDHKNYGVAVEKLTGEILIKQIGTREWPSGPIDLLGYMF